MISVLLFQTVSFGNIPSAEAQTPEELEKERLKLEKDRKTLDEKLQTIQSQINELTAILDDLRGSVDDDKLEDMEEQLAELYDDKSDLQEDEKELLERESVFEEKLKESGMVLEETTPSEPSAIPNWFKSNAKWWKQGLISDGDIINALENLIIQDVIPLDNFVKASSGLEHTAGVPAGGTFVMVDDEPTIPSFQKDVFGFWSDGLVSDEEIVNSIGHLMSQRIINSAKIQGEIAERQAKFDKKMAELDAMLDSDSKFMDKIDGDDYSTTVINPDGSKTITYEDETSTTFFEDGSRITHYPKGFEFNEHDERIPINPFHFGTAHTDTVTMISKLITNPDGTMNIYEFIDPDSFDAKQDVKMMEGLVIRSVLPDLSYDDKPASSGGMEELTQVTVLTIDTIHYPISQFAVWKWTGECDDAWHYHTPTTQAISVDGETGIIDPDQENCGFGKVGEVFVGTWFMSQAEIDKFREKTDSDPLENEAMMGGSDDGNDPVDVNPGPATIEEPENAPFSANTVTSPFGVDFEDSDGDGIGDNIDDEPNKKSKKFGTNGVGLPGEIIDGGDLTISIIGSEDFGAIIIEVGTDGESESVIISVLGVEIEFSAGSIVEIAFG